MLNARLQSAAGSGSWHPDVGPIQPGDEAGGFIAALYSGGDSRIVADPRTGLNKYHCPRVPAPELTCVSSCTASPISRQGFARATAAWLDIASAPSPRLRAHRLDALNESIKARLLQYFGASAAADAILCPSGTDAMLTAAMLVAAERPGEALTSVLPSASETGTGVPMAAVCRIFDGPDTGRSLSDCLGTTVEIPLRSADGSPRSEDAVNDEFASAAMAATGKVIVYLTHSTKTGLIAPVSPPRGTDVIVDACQGRITPETVAAYLGLGWPVVITGSKFFGGPAFSGAVLFPRARVPAITRSTLTAVSGDTTRLGTALRWTAALDIIESFEPRGCEAALVLSECAAAVERALANNSALVPMGGLQPTGSSWADQPSIFSFAVRDPTHPSRLLTVMELRPLHERLAHLGVLLGQPVGLGSFGGLRVAIGAQELLDGSGVSTLGRVFPTLHHVTSSFRCINGDR